MEVGKLGVVGVFGILLFAAMAVVVIMELSGSSSVQPEIVQQVQGIIDMQFVSGTEYNIGEQGQVIVEVRNNQGQPAQSNCSFSIWYPDKSLFLYLLANQSITGNSYVNFTVPAVTGVFEYQANCTVQNKQMVASKSFHVSEFQNETSTTLNRIKAVVPK